ncbi:hypothetical protein TNCT_634491 [Trichonephila clavata]|uniref:Uncharacterized protein n=1 Tax=Trichonephila clavata TaxID=2740835 RepID=A0A8X6LQE5_TRICU|nr:hypothetical protein TNCT_634491 [Trichonephila clavata]
MTIIRFNVTLHQNDETRLFTVRNVKNMWFSFGESKHAPDGRTPQQSEQKCEARFFKREKREKLEIGGPSTSDSPTTSAKGYWSPRSRQLSPS